MTKRLAIQLFGYSRTFRQTFESFQKNIVEANKSDGNKVDIFIHTWDERDYRSKSPISEDDIKFIKDNYKPIKLLIEPQKIVNPDAIVWHMEGQRYFPYNHLYNQFYTMQAANRLRTEYEKEQNTAYDYVIATRMDMSFYQLMSAMKILKLYNSRHQDKQVSSLLFTAISLGMNYHNLDKGIPFLESVDGETCRGIYGGAIDAFMLAGGGAMTFAQNVLDKLDVNLVKWGFENHELFIRHFWCDDCGLSLVTLNYVENRHWDFIRMPECCPVKSVEAKKIGLGSLIKKWGKI